MNISLKLLLLSIALCLQLFGQTNSTSINISGGEKPMKRVTGIGGIFFKSENADLLRDWYKKHLGIEIESWGGAVFNWKTDDNPTGNGATVWNIFKSDSKYFDPSKSTFMINYRVENLTELLDVLSSEGCQVDSKVEESEFGKFGWVMDPEGNRIELWEPPEGE